MNPKERYVKQCETFNLVNGHYAFEYILQHKNETRNKIYYEAFTGY